MGREIGAGAFGRVLKAVAVGGEFLCYFSVIYSKLQTRQSGIKGQEDQTVVAVKTLNPFTSKDVLKSLMSELKIMSHLGSHPHIVNLLGAVTTNIQRSGNWGNKRTSNLNKKIIFNSYFNEPDLFDKSKCFSC